MGQALKNNQKPSFIRLWKWYLLRLNQSSLKPKAPWAIGVELSGLKEKDCITSGRKWKISADRARCGGLIATWDRARLAGGNWGETILAKGKFCLCRRTFPEINTRRGHNSQPARPPSAKNQKLTWQIWKSFWRFYKAEVTKLYSHHLTKWLQYCNRK